MCPIKRRLMAKAIAKHGNEITVIGYTTDCGMYILWYNTTDGSTHISTEETNNV